MSDSEVQYAIVGGGIAGLYTAWRLSGSESEDLRVYEADSRTGGRILTVPLPGMSEFVAELGAMRYTSRHLLLNGLVEAIGLESQRFSFPLGLLYLRGHLVSPEESPPYDLSIAERSRGLEGLIKQGIAGVLSDLTLEDDESGLGGRLANISAEDLGFDTFTPNEWMRIGKKGVLRDYPLGDYGLWNILQDYLTTEAFLLTRDAFGYLSILANWNASVAIPWFLRDFDAEYYFVNGGMQRVPSWLQYLLEERVSGAIRLEMKVQCVTLLDDGTFQLLFEDGSLIIAHKVILALPKRALQKIEYRGFNQANRKEDRTKESGFLTALGDVNTNPLYKLFLGYPYPWWNDIQSGLWGGEDVEVGNSVRATTDLPIRQVYYHRSSHDGGGMIMASYSDQDYVAYWASPARAARQAYREEEHDIPGDEKGFWKRYGLSKPVALRAHRQVKQLHPSLSERIPPPTVAIGKEWRIGWHTWKAGIEAEKAIKGMMRPFGSDTDLFVCGEAFSPEQGWIEGALKSAELVLQELGLSPPDWIENSMYEKHRFSGHEEYIRM